MNDKRYNDILKALPESIVVPLNYVRRFLGEGRAAVMIGAGFSKNAQMDERTHMKTWNELGEDFYRRIHGEDANLDEVRFLSVTRLAQQVEAMFHRQELEACMQQALPNDLISPGELHKALMRLPWKDVFTTNYDTLLERAAVDSERKYNVVTNKETLLYKQSPRIVKLHGTFPNITPFIITEEDFRKYPKIFPEMVNTVRQALIENVFCLIGFSGDDPNFLSWEGWLRDIMGTRVANVYMLDWKRNVIPAELELMRQRNISLINLADGGIINDRKVAFEFLFQFLSSPKEKEQNMSFDFFGARECVPEDVINKLRNIRESYKGWFLLPKNLYQYFRNDESEVFFLSKRIEKWSNRQKLEFLYEMDWRLEISLTPKPSDLYVQVLSLYDNEYKGDSEENKMLTSLRISMLEFAIIKHIPDLFNDIVDLLEKESHSLWNGTMKNRYYYLRCQWEVSIGKDDKVNELLKSWEVSITDYRGVLWKTAILYEVGMRKEGLEILQESLSLLKLRILNTDIDKDALLSYKSMIERNVAIFSEKRYDGSTERYDFRDIYSHLQEEYLKNKDSKDNEEVREEHGFEINDITTRVNLSQGGYKNDFLTAYRLIKLFEVAGRPMTAIYKDAYLPIATLAKYNFRFALGLCFRINKSEALQKVLSRENLLAADGCDIKRLIDDMLSKVKEEDALKYANIKTLIDALSYLMVYSNKEQRFDYFNILVKLFECHHYAYSRKCLSLLYENMSIAEIEEILPRLFEVPFTILTNDKFIEFPELYKHSLRKIVPSDKTISNVINGLYDENRKIESIAHECAYYISLTNLSKEQMDRIRKAIAELRSKNPLENTIYYVWFPYNKNYDKDVDIDKVKETVVMQFGNDDYVCVGSSDFIQRFNRNIVNLIYIVKHLDAECVDWIIAKVTDLLTTNKDVITKEIDDKNANIFFDMRNIVDRTVSLTKELLDALEEDKKANIRKETLMDLWQALKPYEEKGVATLSLKFQLALILKNEKKEKFREKAFGEVLSKSTNLRNAAGNTIIDLCKNGVSIQEALTFVTARAGSVKGASFYLRLLSVIVKNNWIRRTRCADIANNLEEIYKVMEDETISIVDKLDAMHGASILAGCCYANEEVMKIDKLATVVNKWKVYCENEDNFNDIRFGFEKGKNSCF